MNNYWADVLRKLAFGQAIALAVLTAWIIVRFTKKVFTTPPEDRARPAHVALISASYLIFIYIIVRDLYDRMGTPPTWRIPASLAGFAFGLGALAFMISHLSIRRIIREALAHKIAVETNKDIARQVERTERRMQRMEEVTQHTHDNVREMQEGDVKLAQSVEDVGVKADLAYHEANDLNFKIAGFNEEVSGKLTDIKDNAEIARIKASDVSDKADTIGETGNDTNERVRKIERHRGENNQ